jgi:hypothetical protein
MKLLSCALLLMASMAFVLAGCTESATPLVSPNEAVASSATSVPSLAKAGPVLSVTGNCNLWLMGKMGTLTINAFKYEGGQVKGVLNAVTTAINSDPDNAPYAKMHSEVVSLTLYENYTFKNGVSGPTALVWCREFVNEYYKDHYFAYFVVDLGKGKGTPGPDWTGPISDRYESIINLSPQDIVDQFEWAFVPIDVGNVTIQY